MHILHKILVKINDKYIPEPSEDRDEFLDDIRRRAEELTDDYYEQAFDWRETETAGRWEDEYPVNVILSKDDIDRFIEELNGCIASQRREIDYHLENICKTSSDIRELVKIDKENPGTTPNWDLRCLSELMYGVYNCDSAFFNTEEYSAKITRYTIDEVKRTPDKWALVMFDCHY